MSRTRATPSVEELLARRRDDGAGVVVAIRTPAGTSYHARGELPDGRASLLEIGSVTKTMTALLLADLARQGVVGLDDPVADHLPVAPPVKGRPITLRDLATHHSGLPRLPRGALVPGLTTHRHDPYARYDEATLSAAVLATWPRVEPGRRFGYSNLGGGLLGWALARAAGTDYATLLADRVTGPLGLVDTGVDLPPGQERRLAPGHGWRGRPAGRWDLALLAGAGGVVSTAADMQRYVGAFDTSYDGPLAAAAADTRAAQHPAGRVGPVQVGLGWLLAPDGMLFHDGGTGGYRSFVGSRPDLGVSVVVLSARARGLTGFGLLLLRAAVAG
ncbi:serine hydrolase [Nocardioides sp. zg-579]|uniref:Serine hydrolase n=1 Tax=Nocardioides marmotae TaxID=2663857 RepID=A0A6I3J113_9ACTN|nr:serine hydrolase domain-containing protein [Nocardioides marmotae]MCR6030312.1 serine hydrolase [Gordonia jinghuaiqii]MTB93946.1 serine hydrolase [Nocardioides marmotae]QKE00261.1 beta-lactamase family protein [Nocardioides marmotae]